MRKFMLALGWTEVTIAGAIIVALGYFYSIGDDINTTLMVRACLIVPFALWWGIRQIKKYRIPDKEV